jgi:hypothetical protein
MVLREGIEPSASWMSTKRSTSELTEHYKIVGDSTLLMIFLIGDQPALSGLRARSCFYSLRQENGPSFTID